MSSVLLLLLLHCSVLPPSSSSEPLEEHHVAQLLRCFSTDLSLGRHLSLDGAQAHHLHQCSYHLRLFRNWLISGQDPLEYLHGQPPWLRPPYPRPHTLLSHWFSWDCACSVVDSCFASCCFCMFACFCGYADCKLEWCELFWNFGPILRLLFFPSPLVSLLFPPILQSVNSHSL